MSSEAATRWGLVHDDATQNEILKTHFFCSFSLDILCIIDVRWRSDLSGEDLDESETVISADYFWCILGWFVADISCLPSRVWGRSWSYPLWKCPTLLVITVVYWGKAPILSSSTQRVRERDCQSGRKSKKREGGFVQLPCGDDTMHFLSLSVRRWKSFSLYWCSWSFTGL